MGKAGRGVVMSDKDHTRTLESLESDREMQDRYESAHIYLFLILRDKDTSTCITGLNRYVFFSSRLPVGALKI